MNITIATATFPQVLNFADYHDIDCFANDLNKVFDVKIRCAEVGFCGHYWGVFYIGRKPAKVVIDDLLDKAGYEPFERQDW